MPPTNPVAVPSLAAAASAAILAGVERDYSAMLDLGTDPTAHDRFVDSLRGADEADYGDVERVEDAFAASLTAAQRQAYGRVTDARNGHDAWQRRAAYALGVAIGKQLAGGGR